MDEAIRLEVKHTKRIKEAKFTGKGDHDKVTSLYSEYVRWLANSEQL